LPPALLFAVSAILCRNLFFTEYLSHMGSVDGSYIAMARFIMRHWGNLPWWPIWFCGMSFQNVYGPVLTFATAGLAVLTRQSPAWAFHTLSAVLYCLGPVTLGTAGGLAAGVPAPEARRWAFASALLFALTSPAAFLIPAIRTDVDGPLHLRRLQTMVMYGEYPHIAVLTLIPIALILLDHLRPHQSRERKRAELFPIAAAAFVMAVIACTSVTGTVGFAMAALAWLIALPANDLKPTLPRLAIAAVLGYGLAMPWIPPSTIRLVWMNSQWGTGRPTPFTARHLLYFAAIALIAAALRLAMAKLGTPLFLRLAILLMFFSGIVMAAGILPQPYRFHLEFEMGCCIAAGFLWLKTAGRLHPRMQAAIAAPVAVALLAVNFVHTGRYIRPMDIRGTIEYQSAAWFDRHMSGGRVFAPGSISFWMNAFTDTPQLGGCCDQGIPSWEERVALYSVYTGQNMGPREAEVSLLWLQAFGVQAVEAGGPNTREYFKPYSNPRKFDGVLPELWRDGDDVIYRVPQRTTSLAHVMTESQIVSIHARPRDGLDIAPLQTYVAALNDPQLPDAEMRWINPHHALVRADLAPNQIVSVQVSYDRGWHARANGAPTPVTSDGLGLIVLHPNRTGPCTIDLDYSGPSEMPLARGACIVSLLLCAALVLKQRIDKRGNRRALRQQ
jgi:hypothetical protein